MALITEENKKEIFYNFVNAGIAALISFFSALLAAEHVTWEVVLISICAAALVLCIKFKDYWDKEKPEYTKTLLTFI